MTGECALLHEQLPAVVLLEKPRIVGFDLVQLVRKGRQLGDERLVGRRQRSQFFLQCEMRLLLVHVRVGEALGRQTLQPLLQVLQLGLVDETLSLERLLLLVSVSIVIPDVVGFRHPPGPRNGGHHCDCASRSQQRCLGDGRSSRSRPRGRPPSPAVR